MAFSSPEKKIIYRKKTKRKIEGEEISDKAMTKVDKTISMKGSILYSLRVIYEFKNFFFNAI